MADVTAKRVARYEYDGLFRRVAKEITNQRAGMIHRSDDRTGDGAADSAGVLAGHHHDHYHDAGPRRVELASASGGALGQLMHGRRYADEPGAQTATGVRDPARQGSVSRP